LVRTLVQELQNPQEPGTSGAPDIREESQRHSSRVHVYVIWDRWADVRETDRGAIILDAFEQAFDQQRAMQIAVAMGVTHAEAQNLGISVQ